jgi:hypothetical protein
MLAAGQGFASAAASLTAILQKDNAMDAASLFVLLSLAGQPGWSPERSSSPPPAAAPEYGRYEQPPAGGVTPPPSVVDRTRSAISESSEALRDGFETNLDAASEQFQGWSDSASRQLQSTADSLRSAAEQAMGGSTRSSRVSNPFVAPQTPAPTSRTRSGVAPPPWSVPAAANTSDWNYDADEPAQLIGQRAAPSLQPVRTDSGWTSISSQVAAPPLLIPSLTTTTNSRIAGSPTLSSNGSSFSPPAIGGNAPLPNGADSWATEWGSDRGAAQATISRGGDSREPANDSDSKRGQVASQSPSVPQTQSNGSWADLWADDPWEDTTQIRVATTPTPQAPTITTDAASQNPTSQPPLLAPPANAAQSTTTSPIVLEPSLGPPAVGGLASSVAATNEPPWLPLLVVSLSLAGSLGANLFLGWSYLDARLKYSTLVRKTADKFRRPATAAA